jgi:hypothetical protein
MSKLQQEYNKNWSNYRKTEIADIYQKIIKRFPTFRTTPYTNECEGFWIFRNHEIHAINDELDDLGRTLTFCHICPKCGKVWYDYAPQEQFIDAGYIDPNQEFLVKPPSIEEK